MSTQRDRPPSFLFDGPEESSLTLVLAHGAGAPTDTPFMSAMARGVAARGFRVARFEFPYMRARREEGKRKGPDPAPVLLASWKRAVEALGGGERLVIGGKSLGGRIASMIADEVGARGLVCLGYPFHPPGKADRLRTGHLAELRTPALIVQGTRDPLGSAEDVAGYVLAPSIEVVWLADGDHSFKPRASSGHTEKDHFATAVAAAAGFLERLDAARGPG